VEVTALGGADVGNVLSGLLFLAVVLLLVSVVSAVFLGIGTGLARLFPVSGWEATLVVMAVAGVAAWITLFRPVYIEEEPESDLETLVEALRHSPPPQIGARKRRK
jgi:hypothetical protein